MAVIERTRPALWVQATVLGNWYLVLGKTQKQQQTPTNPNRNSSASFASSAVKEVRA